MTITESPYHFLRQPAAPTRGNVTVHVTDILRSAIVTLDLKPGEIIDKGAICERLGVSRFPVSEALARLQAEGLVDILPQRASTVSLIRIADVLEYMLIRKALEAESVRVVTNNLDPSLSTPQPQHRLSARRQNSRTSKAPRARLEFHDIILGDMRSPR